jgi:hypothetical protein
MHVALYLAVAIVPALAIAMLATRLNLLFALFPQVHNQVRKLERTDSVDNMITCCICLDTMYEPVRAPCNHVFCRVCIRRLLEYESKAAVPQLLQQPLQLLLSTQVPAHPAPNVGHPSTR